VEVVPFGEVFDGFCNVRGQRTELVVNPGFEAGQVRVLLGEEPVMHE
jgi:hypothetical protein